MKSIQEFADEAFRDLLKKHRRPVTLREMLRQSARQQPGNDSKEPVGANATPEHPVRGLASEAEPVKLAVSWMGCFSRATKLRVEPT